MSQPLSHQIIELPRPLHVGLCGAPGAGKTTVANFLEKTFGGLIIDDGKCLREASKHLFGLKDEDVYTAQGKDRVTKVCGIEYTNRQLLGELGTLLEDYFGQQFMPEYALRAADNYPRQRVQGEVSPPFFIYPSVRKRQGFYYRQRGGMVIEITRPGFISVNDFDLYEREAVTHTIGNNTTEFDLFRTVLALFGPIYGVRA